MKIDEVHKVVDGLCCMTYPQGDAVTHLIRENRFSSVLELGFHHGVSTCYMAAALDEIGSGHITTIDLDNARRAQPSINELLERLGLQRYVTAFFEPTSYNWRLMKMLEEDPAPRFDFCYVDGAHDWYSDGFAFYLVDRLLRPGGLIVFDDLDWTYDVSPSLKGTERVRRMPADERNTPHIRKVYELLVKPHPAYGNFVERDGWAYARKLKETTASGGDIRREIIYETERVGLGAALLQLAKRLTR